jgi:hypothetical protein
LVLQLHDGVHPASGLISFSLGALVNALLSGFSNWIEGGTAALISAFGRAINSSTAISFGAGFMAEFDIVWRIGAVFALPFLFLATIQAIARQDLSLLLRAVFLRLPLALLFGGIAVVLVAEAVTVTDQMSTALLSVAGKPAHREIASLAGTFVPGPNAFGFSGFIGVFLALLAAGVALLLWLELVLRSAAVAVATLFIPLALVGLIWSATSHWARRIGETIAALVCSKMVIAGVLALASLSLGGGNGVSGAVRGIALLLLAALAPFSLLRLIPIVEAGAVAHLEGLSRRALRGGHAGLAGTLGGFDIGEETVTASQSGSDIPMATPLDLSGPEFSSEVARQQEYIDERARSAGDSSPPSQGLDQ